jgi:hypothetical protein
MPQFTAPSPLDADRAGIQTTALKKAVAPLDMVKQAATAHL